MPKPPPRAFVPADPKKFTTTPFYLLFIEGDNGDYYFPESTFEQLKTQDATLKRLMDILAKNDQCVVLRYEPDRSSLLDVTELFAGLVAEHLAKQGWEEQDLVQLAFTSIHFTNKQLIDIVKGAQRA